MISKSAYQGELQNLKERMQQAGELPYAVYAKVAALVSLNMRYEKVAFRKDLKEHPYVLTEGIIADARRLFETIMDADFIEDKGKKIGDVKTIVKDEKHRELFNNIWNRYEKDYFQQYVDRYIHRIDVNGLDAYIQGKKCIDFGCGNGVFCFALAQRGCAFAVGIDFGESSIDYAGKAAEELGLSEKTEFRAATVYDTGYGDSEFDFAIQNGVFHHVEDLEAALMEARRVIKKGGWFWYYTSGEGSIASELWDVSIEVLKDVPVHFIENILNSMNVNRNKVCFLMDGLNATYSRTTWTEITGKLEEFGFGHFKRLTGGSDTDFDLDRIESDPYGREKFGEGDLRILCQLLDK